jgi:uroporphyrinogen-III synthase
MADLRGARVGVLEARMDAELAGLVRRHGGQPRMAPALREVPTDGSAAVTGLLDSLAAGEVQIVTFMTGVGTSALFDEAERAGRLEELVAALQSTVNVARGQKPWGPLKRRGVPISLTVDEPYTTLDVLLTLRRLSPRGKGVALLHYGERSEAISAPLRRWGATVHDLCLYEWRLPDDLGPVESLVEEVIAGELDCVAFTSQVHVRHLFLVADRMGRGEELRSALNHRSVVAAVGPTCAAALEAAGVPPRVVPTHPKMGPMILAIAAYLEHPARSPAVVERAVSHA